MFLASALACNLPLLAAPTATPVHLPTATTPLLPTTTVLPLSQQWTILTATNSETGKAPDYTIKTQIPVMQGDDPRVKTFNDAVMWLVMDQVDGFKAGLANLPATPISAGSFLENSYEVVSPSGHVISLKFEFYTYSDGAAHPYSYTLTYTYNLQNGQEITFEQLFLPGSNYLELIASYCKNELGTRDIGFDATFVTGADPTPENYHNWNITPTGLLISFDPYQVAAYAAGPQAVTIPYAELSGLIDPGGPLGQFR